MESNKEENELLAEFNPNTEEHFWSIRGMKIVIAAGYHIKPSEASVLCVA